MNWWGVLHQAIQSVGQGLIVFLTGMLIYKNWSDVQQIGVWNALYQPILQGLLASLGNYGISKIKVGGGGA